MAAPEVWLRGPVAGVAPLLQPVAHSLLQAQEEVAAVAARLSVDQLWDAPGGAAPVGYHLKHLAGALDRLFTYARGETLAPEQLAYLKAEKSPGEPRLDGRALVAIVDAVIERALAQVRSMREERLLEPRTVGRQALPSTALGLMFHAAEHTTRHAGQAITTAKIVSAG
jgi:uncharacterized damage-inducible protein DinB